MSNKSDKYEVIKVIHRCAITSIKQVSFEAELSEINKGKRFKFLKMKDLSDNKLYSMNIFENTDPSIYSKNCAHNIVKNNLTPGNVFNKLLVVKNKETGKISIGHFNLDVTIEKIIQ
jgi:hypothetical protein